VVSGSIDGKGRRMKRSREKKQRRPPHPSQEVRREKNVVLVFVTGHPVVSAQRWPIVRMLTLT